MHQQMLLASAIASASAYPTVLQVDSQSFPTAATSHNVNMFATVNAGDGLLAQVASDGSSTNSAVATPSGWTLVGTSYSVNSSHRISVFWKSAAGTEGGTTVDFATTGTEELNIHLSRYQAGTFTGTPEVSFGSAVSTQNPDPPSLSPSWGSDDNAWVAGASYGVNRGTTVYPYSSNNQSTQTSTLLTLMTCTHNETTGTLNPGTFTISGLAATAIPHTIAIRPA